MLRKGIVDRFESGYIVIEIDGTTENFPVHFINGDVVIGDVVSIENNTITSLKSETNALRKEVEDLMNEVWDD